MNQQSIDEQIKEAQKLADFADFMMEICPQNPKHKEVYNRQKIRLMVLNVQPIKSNQG
ncbi:hypothetical protein [Tellurirhabdus bombi]|uniref:hypothetical protein n=1 Tax=Tellurirhabdus bombi TaxID=2907205 RepID=UPI001F2CEEB1|nr:hypothetical protein [Tellurirhabdus bombi]